MWSSAGLAVAIAGLVRLSQAASNDDWSTRSIYQLLTDRYSRSSDFDAYCEIGSYCGGTWKDIMNKLDYIQGMGFTAIQISPVNKNLEGVTDFGESFHGYWVQDLYALNPHFGSEQDLKDLISEVHKRDMYLMVDVVAEDMAYNIGHANMTSSTPIDYSVFNPFDSEDYFNPFCPIDNWEDPKQYQNCWLSTGGVVTPSLRTQDTKVNDMLNNWIKELVSNYSIDGIRIDGAKQAHYEMFQPFVESAGVYAMAEVVDGLADFICKYQPMTGGLENYPLYYTILQAFTTGNIPAMVTMINQMKQSCKSLQYLTTFVENQDNPRFASIVDDIALAANSIAFMILTDGIPKMYYGQEQHLSGSDAPYNRQPLWATDYNTSAPLYILTTALNKIRNHAISLDSTYATNISTILTVGSSSYAARKGSNGMQIISVLSNSGSKGGAYTLSVPNAAERGTNLTEVIGCTTLVVDDNGAIAVDMDKGAPRVFFPTEKMTGSGLCGYSADATTSTPTYTPSPTSATPQPSSTKKGGAERAEISLGLGFLIICVAIWGNL